MSDVSAPSEQAQIAGADPDDGAFESPARRPAGRDVPAPDPDPAAGPQPDAAPDDCAICLTPLVAGAARVTLACNHCFHVACVNGAARATHAACPLCRGPIEHLTAPRAAIIQNAPRRVAGVRRARSGAPAPTEAAAVAAGAYARDEPLDGAPAARRAAPALHVSMAIHPDPDESSGGRVWGVATVRAPAAEGAAAAAPGAAPVAFPVDLVCVLDVSGSMRGAKLDMVKRTVRALCEELRPCDRVGVLAFSDAVEPVAQLTRAAPAALAALLARVDALVDGGGTDIGAAIAHARAMLDQRRARNPLGAVLLLSDGHDSCGAAFDDESLGNLCASAQTFNTIGLGAEHDSAALLAIATRGRGTFAYAADADAVPTAVGACFGALAGAAALEVSLRVSNERQGVFAAEAWPVLAAGESKRLLFSAAPVNAASLRARASSGGAVWLTDDAAADAAAVDLERARAAARDATDAAAAAAAARDFAAAAAAIAEARAFVDARAHIDARAAAALRASLDAAARAAADARAFEDEGGVAWMRSASAAHAAQRFTGDAASADLYATRDAVETATRLHTRSSLLPPGA